MTEKFWWTSLPTLRSNIPLHVAVWLSPGFPRQPPLLLPALYPPRLAWNHLQNRPNNSDICLRRCIAWVQTAGVIFLHRFISHSFLFTKLSDPKLHSSEVVSSFEGDDQLGYVLIMLSDTKLLFTQPHSLYGKKTVSAPIKSHLIRLEKGSNRGIYPNRVHRSGYNKLNFFFTKSLKFLEFKKLIASRIRIWKTKKLLYKNLCSIPNRFWESECIRLCSHNYMLFLGSGTDLGDSSYVKNVTLWKYRCDLQLVFYYLKFSNFLWRKNAAYYTPIGVLNPIRVYTPIGTFL